MARMVHSRGDLQMTIEGVKYIGPTICIDGKMGVWSAQILFEPDDVVKLIGYLLNWHTLVYFFCLPYRLYKNGSRINKII